MSKDMATPIIVAKPPSDVKFEHLCDPDKARKIPKNVKAQSSPWVCCTIVC
jgi:hypothetical protein